MSFCLQKNCMPESDERKFYDGEQNLIFFVAEQALAAA